MAGSISGNSIRRRDPTYAATGSSQLPVHLLMILSQLLSGGYYVITSFALQSGMNRIVLSLYRDILALCCLIPAAYFIERGNRIKLSWRVGFQLLLLGLTGIYGSNYLLFVGIQYTNPGASAAVQPFIPVLTAIIAILVRTEEIRWRRRDGRAKLLGIISCCVGAFVMTFYIGPAVIQEGFHHAPLGISGSDNIEMGSRSGSTGTQTSQVAGWQISGWQFGSICLIGNCLLMAIFINLQAGLLKVQPAPVSVLAYAYVFGAIFMAVTGYFSVRDSSEWALGFDANLITVIYNGLIASALNFAIMSWCLARVGPVFVASYIPMQPIVAAALAFIFLGTSICLGNILGMVFITTGLILVSWARQETFRLDFLPRDTVSVESPFHTTKPDALKEPLIQVGHG